MRAERELHFDLIIIFILLLGLTIFFIMLSFNEPPEEKQTPIEIVKSLNPKVTGFSYYIEGMKSRQFDDKGKIEIIIVAEKSWKLVDKDILFLEGVKIYNKQPSGWRITSALCAEYDMKTGNFILKGDVISENNLERKQND